MTSGPSPFTILMNAIDGGGWLLGNKKIGRDGWMDRGTDEATGGVTD